MTTIHFQIHIPENHNTTQSHTTTPRSAVDVTTRDVAQRITSAQRGQTQELNRHSTQ